jgi:hypothetical protein
MNFGAGVQMQDVEIETPTPPPTDNLFEGADAARKAAEELSINRAANDSPTQNPTLAVDETNPAEVLELPDDADPAMSIRQAGRALSELRAEREAAKRQFDEAASIEQQQDEAPVPESEADKQLAAEKLRA